MYIILKYYLFIICSWIEYDLLLIIVCDFRYLCTFIWIRGQCLCTINNTWISVDWICLYMHSFLMFRNFKSRHGYDIISCWVKHPNARVYPAYTFGVSMAVAQECIQVGIVQHNCVILASMRLKWTTHRHFSTACWTYNREVMKSPPCER